VASESYLLENRIGQRAFLKLCVCRLHLVATGFPRGGEISTEGNSQYGVTGADALIVG
jgi:hypothetical protein